jgi:hypothetical protein
LLEEYLRDGILIKNENLKERIRNIEKEIQQDADAEIGEPEVTEETIDVESEYQEQQ